LLIRVLEVPVIILDIDVCAVGKKSGIENMEILIAQQSRFISCRIRWRQGESGRTERGPVQKVAIGSTDGRLLGKKCGGGRHDAAEQLSYGQEMV
jgi:hypothetical protein